LLSPSEYNQTRSLPNKLAASSPGVLVPFSVSALEARFTWVCLAHHLPSPGFSTLLTASFFQNFPALFHAGNAHGVPPSGLSPLAEPSSPFGPGALLAFAPARRVTEFSAPTHHLLASKALLPAKIRHFRTQNELYLESRCPLGFFLPSRDFPLDQAHHFRGGSPLELCC
jgi:hypothetical protein